MEANVQKKPISLRLPEETLDDMELIAQYLADNGDYAAMWGGEFNKTYAVIYAVKKAADEIRKGTSGKFTKSED